MIGWIALGVMVLALLFFLAKAILSARPPESDGGVLSRERIGQALDDGEALALDKDGWLSEAERLAAAGDFRTAYRAVYLGLLSGLHTERLIDFRSNRTNWTYVRGFRGEEAQRQVFSGLTAIFDRVWYGWERPGDVSMNEVRASVSGLLAEGVEHG